MDEETIGDIEVKFSEANVQTHSLARAIAMAIAQWGEEHGTDYGSVTYNFNEGGN